MDGEVRSLLYDQEHDRVYAFGAFTFAGGIPVNGTAYWEQNAWHPMGQGVHYSAGNPVVSSVLSGDSVFISGFFPNIDSVPDTRNTALWYNGQWNSIGSGGTHGIAWAMLANVDGLTLVGLLDSIAGVGIGRVARGSNGTWASLCSYPVEPSLMAYDAVVKFQGEYIYGGNFNDPGVHEIGYIYQDTLRQLGVGISGDSWVNTLKTYNGKLYVGGEFYDQPNNGASAIMTWDGSEYSNPFPFLQYIGMVNAMDVRNNELYISGRVTIPGVPGYYTLARFNGSEICLFGKNMNVVFRSLVATDTDLFVAPNAIIPSLFGDTLNTILRYELSSASDTCLTIPTGISQIGLPIWNDVRIYPNPSNGAVTIALGQNSPRSGPIIISVYDSTGRLLSESKITHPSKDGSLKIDLATFGEGLRLLRLSSDTGRLITSQLILVQ